MDIRSERLRRTIEILMLGLAARPSPRPVLVPARLSGDRVRPPRGAGPRH